MAKVLDFQISAQPDDVTCGPTCLHAVYRYYGDDISAAQVVDEVNMLDAGGTLDVFLANHAIERGYRVTLYTYNLMLFDPTWFELGRRALAERLRQQAKAKRSPRLRAATVGYLRFLELGGALKFEDLRPTLIRRYVKRGVPIMTGLSSTYLYRDMREIGETSTDDDIRGEPAGHFVVLHGYNKARRLVRVADPYHQNPLGDELYYAVDMNRLIGAILLGCLTYDANLLVVER